MAREILKDAGGKLLGSIDAENLSGREWACDSQGKLLGSFDQQTNTTKDAAGRLLSKGNTLSGLIFKGRR